MKIKKQVTMKLELNQLVEHFTGTAFSVAEVSHYKIESGSSGWQKSAPFPGFIFPLVGKAEFSFNGTPYLASIGNTIHGGANMSLGKRVVGKGRWEYISVLYEINGIEPQGICLEELHFELELGQSPRLTELLWGLWRVYNQPGAIPAFQTETLFRCVLEEVFVCARNKKINGAEDLFEKVSAYIMDHYMDTLTVRELAELNGVTENRLYYIFSKYAGMGPGDYLMVYRLNRGKELLITGDAQIQAVAKSVGYTDALYFSRIFKKRFGVTPSEIRKKNKE